MKSLQMWGIFALGISAGVVLGQAPAAQRTVLKQQDISAPGREAVVARVDFVPGATSGRHTHPGEEITYVVEGEGELLVEGQAPLKIKAGDAFIVPNGAKHEARNTSQKPMQLAAVFVVEKGKPLATPAPQ